MAYSRCNETVRDDLTGEPDDPPDAREIQERIARERERKLDLMRRSNPGPSRSGAELVWGREARYRGPASVAEPALFSNLSYGRDR